MNTQASPSEGADGQRHVPPERVRFKGWSKAGCLAAWGLGGMALIALTWGLGNAALGSWGKRKLVNFLSKQNPEFKFNIKQLQYSWRVNRLLAVDVSAEATNSFFHVERISLGGVPWLSLLRNPNAGTNFLKKARLEAQGIRVSLLGDQTEIRCGSLQASIPGNNLNAEALAYLPGVSDEEFFAADVYRRTRLKAEVASLRITELAWDELLTGKGYRCRLIEVSRPVLNILVNRDKPARPRLKRPLMAQEALASIPCPVSIGRLSLTQGHINYGERLTVENEPGVLSIGNVSLSAEGVANLAAGGAAEIELRSEGDLMEAGKLKVQMWIPVNSGDFSLRYSGSLGAMDLKTLDRFLVKAEGTRIKSGLAKEASFQIEVRQGHARGQVHAIYSDLQIVLLDKEAGNATAPANRVASILANLLKVRSANPSAVLKGLKRGEVQYERKPEDEFIQYLWFALRSGVLDVITH